MFDAARDFIFLNGRLLDRLRFVHYFEGGSHAPVGQALAAYRTESGLYAHGLEPDKRAPVPQPIDQAIAADLLAEHDPNGLADLCTALPALTTPEGGLAFSDASVSCAPHAPWWACEGPQPASINPTGILVAAFRRHGVTGPWVDRAEAFCWEALADLTPAEPHSVQAALIFLAAQTGPRAQAEDARLRDITRASVSLTPNPEGYSFTPLFMAPMPDSPGAQHFTDAERAPHLDALLAAQEPDGGWPINWPAISPGVNSECRAVVTLQALRTLRAFGRV